MKTIKLHGRIVNYIIAIIAITIACEAIAYGQMPSRKPLPEDRLPIPDYYGLYAVTDKGLIELKKGRGSTTQTVGSDTEFIYYAKEASAAESLELYKLPSQIALQNKPKDNGGFKGWNNFIQQGNENFEESQAALEGLPRGSVQIEMRGKSITGKPEMVRLIPGNMLPLGDYQIGVHAGPDSWFRFSVSSGYGGAILSDSSEPKSVQQPNIDSTTFSETTVTINNSNDLIIANSVIAKGNGFEIKRSQLDKVIIGLQSAAAARGQTISPEWLSTAEKQALERLIQIQLLLQKATDDDMANGKKNADVQINTLLDRAGSQEALGQQLKSAGLTIDEFRTKVTQEATATAVLRRELGANMTSAEAKKYRDKLEKETVVEILDPNLKQTPFEKLTASVPSATLFADHTREYSFAYDKVWDAVSSVLDEQHDKIIQSDKDSGGLITDVTRHGIIGFPSYYKYCLLVEKESDASTKITLKLLLYYMDFDGTHGPPNTLEPQNKDFTNGKAESFLDSIVKKLQKGK